jgi:hypothetical protein
VAGQLSQTARHQLAGDIRVAALVREPCGTERLLRTGQTGVGDDPVEQVASGVREVFQQESVPFRPGGSVQTAAGLAGPE